MSKYTHKKVSAPGAPPDQFIGFWQRVINATVPHIPKIGVLALIALVAVVAGWGLNQLLVSRREVAAEKLSRAVKIYQADLLGEKDTAPASEDVPRFKTPKERADAAIAALAKVDEDHSGSAAAEQAVLVRAGVLFDQGRLDEAQATYKLFLDKKPKDLALVALAREGMGLCAEGKGNLEGALAIYKEHTGDLYRDRFLYDQARVHVKKGEKKKAVELYTEILAKSPQTPLRDEISNRMMALED